MTIDQPTATMIAGITAALGAVTAALINKFNWKPAMAPKQKIKALEGDRPLLDFSTREASWRIFLAVVCIAVVVYFSILLGLRIMYPVPVDSRSCVLIALQMVNWMAYLNWASQNVGWLVGYNSTK